MSELLKSYDNAAGRTAQVRYDTARYPRPFWVEARAAAASSFGVASRGVKMLCGTYRTQEEAEHAAAHFMATGDLPKPEIHKNAPKTALPPQGGTSTRPGAKNDFATPLQRQSEPLSRHSSNGAEADAQTPATRVSANS